MQELEEGIWLVRFMDYDLSYIDLEEKSLQPLDNPLVQIVTYVAGTFCYLCVRAALQDLWSGRWESNPGTIPAMLLTLLAILASCRPKPSKIESTNAKKSGKISSNRW